MSGDPVVVTAAERQLAVTHWLLSAAPDFREARVEWQTRTIVVLNCGTLFGAVRIPAATVSAAVETDDRDEIAERLAKALHGGPVFASPSGEHYYALIPGRAARSWQVRGSMGLGSGTCLGVPRPGFDQYPGRSGESYWVVPMDSPGMLCDPDAVAELVMTGRLRTEFTGSAL